MTSADYLQIAFLLAKRANCLLIRPNPFVGAIVVNQQGEIIGEGYHQKAGAAHAEVIAIQHAKQITSDLSNCTLYVTLEPCSHTGKTPPCTNLILENKIPKVVIGSMDPNPMVSGAAILKDAGVLVEICILPEIVELNSTFNINQINKRPKFIVKSASTLNGHIADRFGNSKWISNVKSRKYVHEVLRTNADALLTTAATVIKDNAIMNIRIDEAEAAELNLIVIDKHLEILKKENTGLGIFYKRNNTKIYIVTDKDYAHPLPEKVEMIKIEMPNGHCDLNQLGNILLRKNICEIMVEAGGKLNAALLKDQFIDELVVFICPSLLIDNKALDLFNSDELQTIENKNRLHLLETQILDGDVLLKYQVLY
jgi:diaminohydroxyphosphoribosylaminopyrimidine deaminase/5-amino-6-(5-phosphoribosylamino)uracil reductase